MIVNAFRFDEKWLKNLNKFKSQNNWKLKASFTMYTTVRQSSGKFESVNEIVKGKS